MVATGSSDKPDGHGINVRDAPNEHNGRRFLALKPSRTDRLLTASSAPGSVGRGPRLHVVLTASDGRSGSCRGEIASQSTLE